MAVGIVCQRMSTVIVVTWGQGMPGQVTKHGKLNEMRSCIRKREKTKEIRKKQKKKMIDRNKSREGKFS